MKNILNSLKGETLMTIGLVLFVLGTADGMTGMNGWIGSPITIVTIIALSAIIVIYGFIRFKNRSAST